MPRKIVIGSARLNKRRVYSARDWKKKPRIYIRCTPEVKNYIQTHYTNFPLWCRRNVLESAKAILKFDGIHELNFDAWWHQGAGGAYANRPGFILYYKDLPSNKEPKFDLHVELEFEEEES